MLDRDNALQLKAEAQRSGAITWDAQIWNFIHLCNEVTTSIFVLQIAKLFHGTQIDVALSSTRSTKYSLWCPQGLQPKRAVLPLSPGQREASMPSPVKNGLKLVRRYATTISSRRLNKKCVLIPVLQKLSQLEHKRFHIAVEADMPDSDCVSHGKWLQVLGEPGTGKCRIIKKDRDRPIRPSENSTISCLTQSSGSFKRSSAPQRSPMMTRVTSLIEILSAISRSKRCPAWIERTSIKSPMSLKCFSNRS